jgi:hypothetical protein
MEGSSYQPVCICGDPDVHPQCPVHNGNTSCLEPFSKACLVAASGASARKNTGYNTYLLAGAVGSAEAVK